MADITLTAEQVDDLVAFVRAALDVANYGNDPLLGTHTAFRDAASKALPHLGLGVQWADKPEKKRRKTR